MPQLNLDPASAFLSIELVTSAIIPPADEPGAAPSFDRYLQEATAAAHQTTEADGSPLPASPPEPEDDTARPIDPQSSPEDRSTATEPASDPDRQDGPNGPQSERESETRVSDPEVASNEPSEQDEEEKGEQSETDSPRPAAALDVEALSEPGSQEPSQGDPVAQGVAPESQAEAPEATQQKAPSAATGEPPPEGTEKSGLLDAEKSGLLDAETEAAEESSAPRNGSDAEATKVQEGEASQDGSAPQSDGLIRAGHNRSDAASETSGAAGLPTADASSGGRASPADSRPRNRSARVADRPDPGPILGQTASAEARQMPQDPGTASAVEASDGLEPSGGENAAAGAVLNETGEAEAGASPRAWANQGAQPTSTAQGPETTGPDQAGRVRFVQRVARAFETMGDRGGSVRLRLHPPELGSLRLEVTVRNGTMTARLEVENASARATLLDNLPALRDRLAQQDIRVDRFDVDLADPSFGGSPERPGEHPQPHGQPAEPKGEAHTDPDLEAERPLHRGAVAEPGQGSQLDLII